MRHEARPLEKVKALARLTNENVRAYEKHRGGSAERAFRALAGLVAASRCFEVSLCPRLAELGGFVRSLAHEVS